MNITTSWSSGREPTAGLDQLGIRANSFRMYDHLVPGITNLTNRVRYYSMHAWFIHWWAKNVATDDVKAFNKKLRIFECIVGMAEVIHNYDNEGETPAITGARRFARWIRENKELKSRDVVALETLSNNYWKYGGGGFGQYYRNSAEFLGLVMNAGRVVGLTSEYGIPLAEAFQHNIDVGALERMLREESATVGQLRSIAENGLFLEIPGKECSLLRDILLDANQEYGASGIRRRHACLMLLSLAHQTVEGIDEDPLWHVFTAALHGRTSDGKAFVIPGTLTAYIDLWKTYALHEYFAHAFETLVSMAVDTLNEEGFEGYLTTLEQLADVTAQKMSAGIAKMRWSDLVEKSMRGWSWPMLDPDRDPFDEQSLWATASSQLDDGDSKALETALKLFARCLGCVRDTTPYEGYTQGKMSVMGGRISLREGLAFSETRSELNCREYLSELLAWGLRSHLRLAALKLISTGVYTYKIAYMNGLLTYVEALIPTLSSPRLQQAMRMLTDLGLLRWKGSRLKSSADGNRVLEKYGCL